MKLSVTSSTLILAMFAAVGHAQAADAPIDGHAVFDKWCGICHAPGPLHGGTAGLQAKYNGSKPAELERRSDLTPEFIRAFVRNGVKSMPAFRRTEINDAEFAALAAYLTRAK